MDTKLFVAIIVAVIVIIPFVARGEEPDALAVEWQGKKPCEKLHEDNQIRILRCTFPPGAKHLRHRHPTAFVYALSGGRSEAMTENGTKPGERATDSFGLNAPIPWHEVTNVGDTTLRYLLVEMKYGN